jgi:hypothetical protein
LHKRLLELVLCVLVDVLLVVGDNGLCDCLTDSVNLRSVTTTGNANADVDVGYESMLVLALFHFLHQACSFSPHLPSFCMLGLCRTKLVSAENQDRLVDLESEEGGLDEGKRSPVDLDETIALLLVRFCPQLRMGFGSFTLRQMATAVAVFFLPKHWTC